MPAITKTERNITMKNILLTLLAVVLCTAASAQAKGKLADIKFETTTYDMGTFAADTAIITCPFVYTNTGDVPLYIHQVFTSCGCTQRSYSTAPLMPGESDTIIITYDGTKKSPGPVRKSITIHCNAPKEMYKIYIKGKMLEAKITPTGEPFTEQ